MQRENSQGSVIPNNDNDDLNDNDNLFTPQPPRSIESRTTPQRRRRSSKNNTPQSAKKGRKGGKKTRKIRRR